MHIIIISEYNLFYLVSRTTLQDHHVKTIPGFLSIVILSTITK